MSLGACLNVSRERGWPCSVVVERERPSGRGGACGGRRGVWGEVKMSVWRRLRFRKTRWGVWGAMNATTKDHRVTL